MAEVDGNTAAEAAGVPVGDESVVPPVHEIQAEPGPQSTASAPEETVADSSSIDPVGGTVEAVLAEEFDVLGELGKGGLKVAESAAGPFSESFKMFAGEMTDYSKNCFENRAAFVGALLNSKTLESAVQIQTNQPVLAFWRIS